MVKLKLSLVVEVDWLWNSTKYVLRYKIQNIKYKYKRSGQALMQRCSAVTLMDFRSLLSGPPPKATLSGRGKSVARHLQLQSCPWSTSFPSSGEKNTNTNTIIPSFTWMEIFFPFLKYAPELLKFLPHHLIKTASWVKSSFLLKLRFQRVTLGVSRCLLSQNWQ